LWSDEFRIRFKDGFTVFRDYEKQFLDYQDKKFNQIYDNLDVSCFSKIKACYFSGQDFINEVCEKLMFEEGFSIVFCYNTRTNRISIRTKEDNIDLGEILKKLDFGGGHPKAAGMNLCSTNLLQERLENIENYMYKHFENVRN
jgi:nanoRNase/pAp phosphatase (c-di-AMP/oligoRNAs hydrolase)